MKTYILYFAIFILLPNLLSAQAADYAGMNVSTCQQAGADIGNASPGNVCYTWDVAKGLNPGDMHSFHPHVNPQETTTYTVHVSGSNFTFSTTDQVTVTVIFGGLVLSPSYIKLSGPLENQAMATVTIPANVAVNWSIENGGSTGCEIDNMGVISNCHTAGQITVVATKQSNPSCKVTKDLAINGGIKDVIASDNANDGRIAHHGQTLYLVGSIPGTANFEAVPNENSSFPAGEPSWTGPYMPPPGNEISWNSPSLSYGTYTETAGTDDPKSVTVQAISADEFSTAITIDTTLFGRVQRLLRGGAKVNAEDQFCFSPLKFTFPAAMTVSYKSSYVGKFKDPGYDTKRDFTVEIPAVSGTGCMYFPCCTGAIYFGPVPVLYTTYVAMSAGISISTSATKDPSVATPAKWMSSGLSVAGTIRLDAGFRLEADVANMAGFTANANLSTEVKLEGRYVPQPPKLEWNASWGGLVGKVSGTFWYGSPDTAIELAYVRNLLPGAETGWNLLYQFPN
ncbi:MAG: hypothetical protein ABJC12_02135 [Saprospiraceae bacterium]